MQLYSIHPQHRNGKGEYCIPFEEFMAKLHYSLDDKPIKNINGNARSFQRMKNYLELV